MYIELSTQLHPHLCTSTCCLCLAITNGCGRGSRLRLLFLLFDLGAFRLFLGNVTKYIVSVAEELFISRAFGLFLLLYRFGFGLLLGSGGGGGVRGGRGGCLGWWGRLCFRGGTGRHLKVGGNCFDCMTEQIGISEITASFCIVSTPSSPRWPSIFLPLPLQLPHLSSPSSARDGPAPTSLFPSLSPSPGCLSPPSPSPPAAHPGSSLASAAAASLKTRKCRPCLASSAR